MIGTGRAADRIYGDVSLALIAGGIRSRIDVKVLLDAGVSGCRFEVLSGLKGLTNIIRGSANVESVASLTASLMSCRKSLPAETAPFPPPPPTFSTSLPLPFSRARNAASAPVVIRGGARLLGLAVASLELDAELAALDLDRLP